MQVPAPAAVVAVCGGLVWVGYVHGGLSGGVAMTAVSASPAERARKAAGTILQALQVQGMGVAIAAAMGVSESTVSRLKNEHLDDFCRLLAHAGLKVVPADRVCIDPKKLEALATIAAAAMQTTESTKRLVWEDD